MIVCFVPAMRFTASLDRPGDMPWIWEFEWKGVALFGVAETVYSKLGIVHLSFVVT